MQFTEDTNKEDLPRYWRGAFTKWKKRLSVPIEKLFWDKVKKGNPNECWVFKSAEKSKRYGVFALRDGRRTSSNRVAWILSKGHIPDGLYVLHKCDNPPCCNPDHLFLGTKKDNSDDMIAKNRKFIPSGELSPTAKLTDSQVLEIRKRYDPSKTTYRALADEFGISHHSVREIVNGKTWKHIEKINKKLTYSRGAAHPHAKLTTEAVKIMREMSRAGQSTSFIAKHFEVAFSTAKNAILGKTWTHTL